MDLCHASPRSFPRFDCRHMSNTWAAISCPDQKASLRQSQMSVSIPSSHWANPSNHLHLTLLLLEKSKPLVANANSSFQLHVAINILGCYRIYLVRKQKSLETKSPRWKFTAELKNNHHFSLCNTNIYKLHLLDTFPRCMRQGRWKIRLLWFYTCKFRNKYRKTILHREEKAKIHISNVWLSSVPTTPSLEAGRSTQVSLAHMSDFEKLLCIATMRLCMYFFYILQLLYMSPLRTQ